MVRLGLGLINLTSLKSSRVDFDENSVRKIKE